MSKVIKTCPNCGSQFEAYDGKKGKTYCSNECYKEHKGIGVKKFASCVVCGKEFELKHGMGTKVCSTECLKKLRSQLLSKPKKTSICKNCGKTFEQLYTTSEANFCCRECYWKYRNAHKNEFEYVSQKRISNTHETRVCEMCGKEFVVYKKTQKRFCSDKCRVAYSNTEECRNKRLATMLERYGKASVGTGMSAERLAEIERTRLDKYQKLCDKSNLDIIEYVDRHIIRVRCRKCGGEFVTNNLSNSNASVDDMAAATATSRSSLNRKTKNLLGVTPADFMKEARMKRACQMLMTTTDNINDIAYACGFADAKYFSKCFKASRGMSPSEYRTAEK